MNALVEHHQDNIKFRYRCFDRLLLHRCIQSFLDGARARGFFWAYRKVYPVARNVLREVANQYHNWSNAASMAWPVGSPGRNCSKRLSSDTASRLPAWYSI